MIFRVGEIYFLSIIFNLILKLFSILHLICPQSKIRKSNLCWSHLPIDAVYGLLWFSCFPYKIKSFSLKLICCIKYHIVKIIMPLASHSGYMLRSENTSHATPFCNWLLPFSICLTDHLPTHAVYLHGTLIDYYYRFVVFVIPVGLKEN